MGKEITRCIALLSSASLRQGLLPDTKKSLLTRLQGFWSRKLNSCKPSLFEFGLFLVIEQASSELIKYQAKLKMFDNCLIICWELEFQVFLTLTLAASAQLAGGKEMHPTCKSKMFDYSAYFSSI